VAKLLTMLAPVLLGALGRTKQENGLDASALSNLLGLERKRAQSVAPQSINILTQFLDADGDGDATDDIVKKGFGFPGKLIRGKKIRGNGEVPVYLYARC